MPVVSRSQVQHLGFAVLCVVLASGLMLVLDPWLSITKTPFLLFFGALTLSAWYGGRSAGILATLLSAAIATRFLEPSDQIAANELTTLLFILQGLLISYLCGSRHWVPVKKQDNTRQGSSIDDAWQNSWAKQQLELQARVTHVLASSTASAEETVIQWLQVICEGLGFQVGTLWQVEPATDRLTEVATWQVFQPRTKSLQPGQLHRTLTQEEGLAGQAWATHQPLWQTDCTTPLQDLDLPESTTALQTAIAVPMLLENQVWGVIECWSVQPQPTNEAWLKFLTMLGSQLAQFLERRRIGIALQESQQLFQDFMNYSPMNAYIKDEMGRYIYVNQRVEQSSNRPVSGWIGKTDQDLFPLEIAQPWREHDLAVLESGQMLNHIETMPHADGMHYYMTFKFPLRNAEQQLLAGISVDITDRIRAEEALKHSERVYRAIGETIDYGIWVCDPDGRNIYASESFLNLVGITQAECSEFGWGNVLHPDDAERTIAAWKECAKSGNFWDIEHRYLGVDGRWHPILARGVPVRDDQGETLCWAGINLDISSLKRVEAELRESEERFRLAAQAVAGVVYDWNLQTKMVYRSEGLHTVIGVRPEVAPPASDWWAQRVHPEDAPFVQQFWADMLSSTENRYGLEYRIRHEEGHWVYIWDQGYVIRDETGQIVRVVGSSTDITDRKQAETERDQILARERAAREEAEAANRIKDEFLAVLSHELRSPLNPILGWAKLLQTRKFDPETVHRALETIERNARLQAQLIEDLLDVSRILQGKMALKVALVDLNSTIEAAIETTRLAAEAKGIQIQTSLNPAVKPILGDAGRLQQIIWNLLANAVKFTPNGGQVEVRLEQEDGAVKILVQDNGRGISPSFLPYVFEYFRQADSTTTRQFGGLGLGLAIVRHLTELHGGTVEAASPGDDQGATFMVRLPSQTPTAGITSLNPRSISATNLGGLKLLVVDDDEDMRDLASFVLSEYGAIVKSAASATEALAILDQEAVDVLISDIGMPNIDGYELMRKLRACFPSPNSRIPAVALTAYAGEYNEQQAIAAGFQIHLSKPVDPAALATAIARVLGRNQPE